VTVEFIEFCASTVVRLTTKTCHLTGQVKIVVTAGVVVFDKLDKDLGI
jgi:pectin methylesterase-like acyl-CoA thioesterase